MARGDYNRLTETEVLMMIRLYRDGWGERNIALMSGRHESTVRTVLRGKHRHNRRRIMNGQRPKKTLAIYQ